MEITKENVNCEKKSQRIIYFDFLRVVATIAVIILHTAATQWGSTDIHSISWNMFNVYDSIVRWAVPVFTMISGALFLNNNKELNIKTLYTKNIFRLVTAFLFWSIIYAVIPAAISSREMSFAGVCMSILSGHYHQWFLFMIVGLYIITPLLRKITEDRKSAQYFLIVSFVFTIFIPTILLGLKAMDALLDTGGTLYDFANAVYSKVNFHFAIGYSFYYVLGHYLNTIEFSKKVERSIYIFGGIGFASTIFLTKEISCYLGYPSSIFYGNMTINVALESIAVFTFVKCKAVHWIKTAKQEKTVKMLSKCSFGIYSVHAGLLSAVGKCGLTTVSFNSVFSVIIIAGIVFLLSFALSWILNKIPIINKYFV